MFLRMVTSFVLKMTRLLTFNRNLLVVVILLMVSNPAVGQLSLDLNLATIGYTNSEMGKSKIESNIIYLGYGKKLNNVLVKAHLGLLLNGKCLIRDYSFKEEYGYSLLLDSQVMLFSKDAHIVAGKLLFSHDNFKFKLLSDIYGKHVVSNLALGLNYNYLIDNSLRLLVGLDAIIKSNGYWDVRGYNTTIWRSDNLDMYIGVKYRVNNQLILYGNLFLIGQDTIHIGLAATK